MTLEHLKHISHKVDQLVDDMQMLKKRVSAVELRLSSVEGAIAGTHIRMDKMDRRLDRIATSAWS